jgi:ArsR family transcriptional regulator
MPTSTQLSKMEKMEALFKALGDATRLRILGLLLTGEVCVCDIHQSLKIPQPKASRHLAYLRNAGLVETRRDGLWVHYRMATLPDPVLKTISEAVRHALTHMDVVHRDAERLQRKTGCCLPAQNGREGLACCEPQQQPVAAAR